MGRTVWFASALVSYSISVALFFNSHRVDVFVIGALLMGSAIFGIVALIIGAVRSRMAGDAAGARTYRLLALGAAIVVVVVFVTLMVQGFCRPIMMDAHLRTNTITGTCELVAPPACRQHIPWYYEDGCDISVGETRELLRERLPAYEMFVERCSRMCEAGAESYCVPASLGVLGVSCHDLLACEGILCP